MPFHGACVMRTFFRGPELLAMPASTRGALLVGRQATLRISGTIIYSSIVQGKKGDAH